MTNKFNVVSSMTSFDAIYTDRISVCGIASTASVKVVHWKASVRRYFVQALSVGNRFLHSILVIEDLVCCKYKLQINAY